MDDLTARVKRKARELGFTGVGIAEAAALEEEGAHLREWLDRGYHASMAWMARNTERRTDPRNILPGARSVVVVALNYYDDTPRPVEGRTGKISRYAWGDDYHDVMGEKLGALRLWLTGLRPGTEARLYVDTGPVMEKAWAARAGVGWLGKHANVITRDVGSWVFLGEILTTLALEPDAPALDRCGTCTRCIAACPTGAIVEPYVVDSNRCLSYLTIEHRGAIDGALHGQFDGGRASRRPRLNDGMRWTRGRSARSSGGAPSSARNSRASGGISGSCSGRLTPIVVFIHLMCDAARRGIGANRETHAPQTDHHRFRTGGAHRRPLRGARESRAGHI